MKPVYPLLGLLLEREQYGYDLKRTVDREFAPFWKIDFGQLYRSLHKMTEGRWVRVQVRSGSRGPSRKVYAITPRGRQAFTAWLAEPALSHDEFLVKARFAAERSNQIESLLEARRRELDEEYIARAEADRAVRASTDFGRLLLTDAALRETDSASASLDLFTAITGKTSTYPSPHHPFTIIGSDDPLLTYLTRSAHISARVVGSLNGLLALAQHQANVAGVHLLDVETGEYNVPFIKHLMPEDEIVLVNLALRENGLLVARGNPKNIHSVQDLTRRGIRFINRQRGTGTRLLLLTKLHAAGLSPHAVRDWERVAMTHDGVAGAVASGSADVGPGLRAVAAEWNLDFIPLGEERFDLAILRADFESPALHALMEAMHSRAFRHQASEFQGYDLARMGQVVARIK